MKGNGEQAEFFGLIWRVSLPHRFRLRAGDVIRLDGKLARVIRVNDCAAVVVMNRKVRDFTTRFDRHVRFQPSPVIFRISPNSEAEIVTPKATKKRKPHERNIA